MERFDLQYEGRQLELWLAAPTSILREALGEIHIDCTRFMPSCFGLPPNSVSSIPLRFEKSTAYGLFDHKEPEIIIDPLRHQLLTDAFFTVAHETGHYMHYLVNPDFYKARGDVLRSDAADYYVSVRECIANMAALEFFDRTNRFHPYFNYVVDQIILTETRPIRPFPNEVEKSFEFNFSNRRRNHITQFISRLFYQRHGGSSSIAQLSTILPSNIEELERQTQLLEDIGTEIFSITGSRSDIREQLLSKLK
jgi:hypothetical protein